MSPRIDSATGEKAGGLTRFSSVLGITENLLAVKTKAASFSGRRFWCVCVVVRNHPPGRISAGNVNVEEGWAPNLLGAIISLRIS